MQDNRSIWFLLNHFCKVPFTLEEDKFTDSGDLEVDFLGRGHSVCHTHDEKNLSLFNSLQCFCLLQGESPWLVCFITSLTLG